MFIERNSENRRVKLTVGGKLLLRQKLRQKYSRVKRYNHSCYFVKMIPLITFSGNTLADINFLNRKKMSIDEIKLFTIKEKELKTLIQTVRIYSQDIGIEFGVEKCAMRIIKNGKRHMTEKIELQNQEKSSEKKQLANTLEYCKRPPTNKWRWKKNKLQWVYRKNHKATRNQFI